MKNLQPIFSAIALSAILFSSCQRNAREETAFLSTGNATEVVNYEELAAKASSDGPCNSTAYTVTLESQVAVGANWEWTWSVQNPNPGNGNNGTAQDLSHWGMQLGTCFNPATIVSASYSANGSAWINFTPVIQPDPSQNCLTTPTLKFDFGTNGSAKTYYRLVVSQNYSIGSSLAYYKAGKRCCTFAFSGIACGGPVEIVE